MKNRKAKASAISTPSGLKVLPARNQDQKPLPQGTVLSLDLSLRGTGLIIWDGTEVLLWRLLQTEGIKKEGQSQGLLPSGKYRGHLEDRIEWQRKHIAKAFRKFLPELVVLEEYAFGARGRGLSGLHELGGVVKNYLFRKEAVYLGVQNAIIKQYATGKGGASKQEMIASAQKYWPECPSDSNVADAFWIGHWGYFHKNLLIQNITV